MYKVRFFLGLWLPWRLIEVSCKLIIIFYPWTRMRVILLYHINYGVRQGFPALKKAVTTQMKKILYILICV